MSDYERGTGTPATERLLHEIPGSPVFKRMLGSIPPSDKEIAADVDLGIAAAANGSAVKRSEARRDAILAVSLAIARRGGNPLTDWTTKDTDTAYVVADLLAALGG
jgi:hypothetical protein